MNRQCLSLLFFLLPISLFSTTEVICSASHFSVEVIHSSEIYSSYVYGSSSGAKNSLTTYYVDNPAIDDKITLRIHKWEGSGNPRWKLRVETNGTTTSYMKDHGGNGHRDFSVANGQTFKIYLMKKKNHNSHRGWHSKFESEHCIVKFEVDNTPPTTGVSSPSTSWMSIPSRTLSAFPTDSGAGISQVGVYPKECYWVGDSKIEEYYPKKKVVTAQGLTQCTYYTQDRLGNSDRQIYNIRIDRERPQAVNKNSLSGPLVFYENNVRKIRFNWDPVEDLPPANTPYIQTSGINHYEFKKERSQGPTESVRTNLANPSISYDFSAFVHDIIYNPQVQSFDNSKNGATTNASKVTALDPFVIQIPAKLMGINDSETESTKPYFKNGKVHYPLDLTVRLFPMSVDKTYGVAKLKLYRRDSSIAGATWGVVDDNLEVPKIDGTNPTGLISGPANTYYTYHYELELIGKEHAHKNYEYKLETVYNFNQIGVNGKITPFTDSSNTYTFQTPNLEIKEDLVFELYKGSKENPEYFTTVNSSGIVVEKSNGVYTETSQNIIYTNESLFVRLVNTLNNQSLSLDPEGDRISFRMERDDTTTFMSDVDSQSLLEGEIVSLPEDLIPPTTANGLFSIYVTDLYDNDKFQEPYGEAIELSLFMDNEIDSFDVQLTYMPNFYSGNKYIDKDTVLGSEKPSMSLSNLNLKFSHVDDSQSGIKSIEAFNISSKQYNDSGLDQTGIDNQEIYPSLYPGSENVDYKLESEIQSGVTKYNIANFSLPSGLKSEMDKAYTIIRVSDFAGNEEYRHLVTPYDSTAPSDDIHFEWTHNETDNFIKISLLDSFGNPSKGALYDWDLSNQDSDASSDNGWSPEDPFIFVDTEEMGFNEAKNITLYIIDKAGNSTFIAGQFCTNADLTNAEFTKLSDELKENYDTSNPDNTAHYLSWKINATSTASFFHMERFISESQISELNVEDLNGSFIFTDSNLKAHETYKYNLYPVNQLGEINRNISEPITRTLKNNPPGIVDIISPVNKGYTTSDPKFVYYFRGDQFLNDPDGDSVKYSVYIEKNPDEFVLVSSDTLSEEGDNWAIDFSPEDPAFILEHGKVYTWKIISEDTIDQNAGYIFPQTSAGEYLSKSTSSKPETFTVDAELPQISDLQFGDNNSFYHSSNLLTFQLSDGDSGINDVHLTSTFEDGETKTSLITEIEKGVYNAELPDGFFDALITASDKVGNVQTLSKSGICVDTEMPVISGTLTLDSLESGQLITAGKTVELSLTAGDQVTEVESLTYTFRTEADSVGFTDTIDLSSLNAEDNIYNLSIPFDRAVNRQVYSLEVYVTDQAGNNSLNHTNKTLTVMRDLTPPVVDITLSSGFTAASGGMYVSDLSDVETIIDMDVQKYGIVSSETQYGIKNWETGVISLWEKSLSSLLSGTSLEDGIRYSIAVEAVNYLGLRGIGLSEVFIFDKSAPVSLSISGISSEPYISGETFRIKVRGIDDHSTISQFSLKIGTAENPTLLSEKLNGQRDGMVVKDLGDGNVFSFAIPEETSGLENGAYNIILRAINGAGLSSAYEDLLVVDNSQDKIAVSDSELYTSTIDSISGRWSYSGEKTVTTYNYALIKESLMRNPLQSEWVNTVEDSVNILLPEDSLLEQGETYKFFVQAYFNDDTFSSIYSNYGVTVDTSAVQFNSEIETPRYAVSKEMWVNWDLFDSESDIQSIEAIVERLTYNSNGEIIYTDDKVPQPVYERLAEIDLPAVSHIDKVYINSDRKGHALDLNTGDRIYITIRATNGAGLITDRVSQAVVIDDTPPPTPLVLDSGDSIKPTETVLANWLWSELDRESGNVTYQWTVYNGSEGFDSSSWSNNLEEMEITGIGTYESLGGVNDDLYYIAVKAINGAGLETIGISNGILLDSEAPDLADVVLTGTTGNDDQRYINSREDLVLKINATDNHLIKTYKWSYGTYDEYAQWTEIQSEQESDISEINFDLSSKVVDGNILTFKTSGTDKSDNTSAVGYSKGVMYDSTIPEVYNINGYLSGDILKFDWESRHVLAPVVSYSYSLIKLIGDDLKPAGIVKSGVVTDSCFSIDVSDSEFEDNFYVLDIIAETEAANHSTNSISNIVMVDKSAPEITRFFNNRFTSKKVDFHITAEEPTSRITEFQYAIGTFENPNTITGKWKNVVTGANTISRSFLFANLPGGNDSVIDGTELLVRVRVKNSAGLWSPVISGRPILVDKTPAVINSLSVAKTITVGEIVFNLDKAYTSNSTLIDKIAASTTDEQSGIQSYRFGIASGTDIFYWGPIVPVSNTEDEIMITFDEDLLSVSGGFNLSHDSNYRIVMRAYNGSDDSSDIVFSNEVTADFVSPEIIFDPAACTSVAGNLHREELDDGLTRLISNGEDVNIAYVVHEENSELVIVEFDLILPSMDAEDSDSIIGLKADFFSGMYLFDKNKTETYDYGEYQIIARLTDAAGNSVDKGAIQTVRLNSPPLITLTDNITTPGQPMTFKLAESATDDDGISSCRWDFGNGELSAEMEFTTLYTHHKLWDSETDYTLKLSAIDSYGKAADKEINIKVLNTSAGVLYMDEYWSGDHIITGLVEVPELLTLNIADFANIYSSDTPEGVLDVGLLINGILNVGNNIHFTIHPDLSHYFWRGIHVNGTANIGQSTISRAIRGLTATGTSEVGLVNTTFTENKIGIHGVGSGNVIVLSDLFFFNNYEYAIKEDKGAVPYVSGCQFTGNTYDYYDTALTAIDYLKLNELSSNTGNKGN